VGRLSQNTTRYAVIVAAGLLLSSGCSSVEKLNGRVLDVFDQPVGGATIALKGQTSHLLADSRGNFSLEITRGQTLTLMAGKDGFVRDKLDIDLPENNDEKLPRADFTLFPEPAEPGFYGLGYRELNALPKSEIHELGSELEVVHGLRDISDTRLAPTKEPHQFVFRSTLRRDEIARLDLKLLRLDFVEKQTLKGVTGPMESTVELWLPQDEVPFELRGMLTRDLYLLTTNERLEAGMYAFEDQAALSSRESGSLLRLSQEMRVAHVFEVR
jgi:hypothetical protein